MISIETANKLNIHDFETEDDESYTISTEFYSVYLASYYEGKFYDYEGFEKLKDELLKEHNSKLEDELLNDYSDNLIKEIKNEIISSSDDITYFKEMIDCKASWSVAMYMSEEIYNNYICGKYDVDCEEVLECFDSYKNEFYYVFIFGERFYDFVHEKEQIDDYLNEKHKENKQN